MSTKSVVETINIDANGGVKELPEKEENGKRCTKRVLINSAILAAWIVACEGLGFALGYRFYPTEERETSTLISSPGAPPSIAFPIIWTFLLLSLAIVGWFLCLGPLKVRQVLYTFILFCLQLILAFVWIPVYQNFYKFVAGLVILCVTDVITGVVLVKIWLLKIEILGVKTRNIALIMVPYFLWILYATHLNAYTVAMNPDRL